MARAEKNKWEAFKAVKEDNVEGLRAILADHHFHEWSRWQNYSGKTLLDLAESEREREMGGFSDTAMYLRERMMREGMGAGSIRRQPVMARELTVDDPAGGRSSPSRIIREPMYPDPAMTQSIITEPVSARTSPVRTQQVITEQVAYQEPLRTHQFITEPLAYQEPVMRQQFITEPVANREPVIPREPVVPVEPVIPREPIIPVEPVIPRGPVIPSAPQVVSPNLVEKSLEVLDRQDHHVIVEVPQQQFHTITREIPRVNIIETTETQEVPVDHKEEVLNVSLVPEITKVNVPKVTVHQKVEFRPTHSTHTERDVVIEEPLAPPTVEVPHLVIRPEPTVNPMYIMGPTDITHREETKEYDVDYTLPRTEVHLKPVVEKVTVPVQVPQHEEHIVQVPEEYVETREVLVPEVTTVKKVHYVPSYPSQTAQRYVEPLAEPIAGRWDARGPIAGRVDRQYVDLDGVAGEDMQRELERLRSENRQQEDEGLQMQEELRRYQAEVDQLSNELSKEKRLRHELGVKLKADQQNPSTLPPSAFTTQPAGGMRANWYGEERPAGGRWSPPPAGSSRLPPTLGR